VLTLDLMACEGSSVLEEVEATGATNLTEVLWQEERAESSSVDHSSNAGPGSAASSQDHSANYSTQSSALNNFTKSKKDRNLLNGCSLAKHSEGGLTRLGTMGIRLAGLEEQERGTTKSQPTWPRCLDNKACSPWKYNR
jgi:hypothetical protein